METHINGIPCIIQYTITGGYKPARINAPPENCYEAEYPGINFRVCDRNGRPAPWLECKMTDKDRERIESEILEYQNE